MKRTRRNHDADFKAQEALATLAEQVGVHPIQITECKRHLLERAANVFGGMTHKPHTPDLTFLRAKNREVALENEFSG